jgi:chromosome segregation ATPase
MSALEEYRTWAKPSKEMPGFGRGIDLADAAIAELERYLAAGREEWRLVCDRLAELEAELLDLRIKRDNELLLLERAEAAHKSEYESFLAERKRAEQAEQMVLEHEEKYERAGVLLTDRLAELGDESREWAESFKMAEESIVELQAELFDCKWAMQHEEVQSECERTGRLKAEATVERLRCCCKCIHEDHDMHDNWWCQFDPEPMNPNEFSTIEPHENCHFTPSRWAERGGE